MSLSLRRVTRSVRMVVIYVAAFLIVAVSVLPFLYTVESSLRPTTAMFSLTPWVPPPYWTLANYTQALFQSNFLMYFRNSILVGVATSALSIVIGAPAAYALARLRVPARNVIATTVLFVYMIPSVLLLIPLYLFFADLHLVDSDIGLVIAYTTFSIPFSVWLLRAFFMGIPVELEEAAQIDGCSTLGVFRRIALPLVAPGLATAAVYSFILAWNEVLVAVTFITSESKKTIPVGISAAFGQYSNDWALILPATVIAGLPVLAFFWVLGKYFVKGLVSGGVTGQ